MKTSKIILSSAISGLLALGAGAVTTANADTEKCYGVVKAGQNDCQTSNSSCAGTSHTDGQKDAWVSVPKGLCDKLVGGSKTST